MGESQLNFQSIMKHQKSRKLFQVFVLFLSTVPLISEAQLRRCFACRSRGPLGDCRDPFYVTGNSTTLEHKSHGVKTIPCASGWCSKVLEDVDEVTSHEENYGSATQRDCLQRAPSDGQQRCAFVKVIYVILVIRFECGQCQ